MSPNDPTLDPPPSASLPWWTIAVCALACLLFAIGGLIGLIQPASLLAPGSSITVETRIFVDYFVSRNLALAVVLLIGLLLKSRTTLARTTFLAGLVQCFDCILDARDGRWVLVPGILLLGLLFLVTASRIMGAAFWRKRFWLAD